MLCCNIFDNYVDNHNRRNLIRDKQQQQKKYQRDKLKK